MYTTSMYADVAHQIASSCDSAISTMAFMIGGSHKENLFMIGESHKENLFMIGESHKENLFRPFTRTKMFCDLEIKPYPTTP